MSALAKRNAPPTECTIRMVCEVVRLLKEKEQEIRTNIKARVSAPIELYFHPRDGFIVIKGLQNDIDVVEELLYAQNVFHDTAETNEPGPHINAIFLDIGDRTKGLRWPLSAREPHFVHPWDFSWSPEPRLDPGLRKEMFTEHNTLLEGIHSLPVEVEEVSRPNLAAPINNCHRQQSSSKIAPSDIGRTNIRVVSGSITEFKADALVNTIGDKSLERGGVVLRQFLEAGHPNLEQELRKLDIPEVFGRDVVVTRAFGSIDAKFVLHAAIEIYQEKSSLDKLYNTIKICLQMAVDRNATKIAFPTLGCGGFAFKPEDVVQCFLRAQRDTKTNNLKIRIVALDENLRKQFHELIRRDAKRNTREGTVTRHQNTLTGLLPIHTRATGIKVVLGNITRFKADVLVNTIGDKSLERGGVVLRQFLEAGHPHLKQELRKFDIPEVFGRDVVVTRAFGYIDAKFVLHAAIEKYQEKSSLDKLYKTIMICLQMAMDKNATTIAFPTLGCGNLVFKSEDVAKCFIRAERDSRTNLKIFIIAFEEDLRNQFESKLDELTCQESKQNQKEHLARISGSDCYPVYWTAHKRSGKEGSQFRVVSSSAWYDEVSQMVMKTWDQQKVGQGFDAKGLGNHAIKITRIFYNENPLLMNQYTSLREIMSKSAEQRHRLADQNNEAEISTMALGLENLYGTLSHQLNEVFLFHGTKSDAVKIIAKEGIDTRLCGENLLFGSGSYFAESSTKADQYADPKEQRTSLGRPLYMYLCRVLLGSTYVCSDPKNIEGFRRPPCMELGCHRESCLHSKRYDSVVGTHRPDPQANGRLHFREFVVYRLDQSYPDFLIEYQRVAYP